MKIIRVEARNVLSFPDELTTLDLANYNLIVGPNASGKTNLLRLLAYPTSHLTAFGTGPENEFYRAGSPAFEFRIDLELGGGEAEALVDYIICSMLGESVTTNAGENQQANMRLAFEIASKLRTEFVEALRYVSLRVKGQGKEGQPPILLLRMKVAGTDRFVSGSLITNSSEGLVGSSSQQLARALLDAVKPGDETALKVLSSSWPSEGIFDGTQFDGKAIIAQVFGLLDAGKLGNLTFPYSIDLRNMENQYGTIERFRALGSFLRAHGIREGGIQFIDIMRLIYSSSVLRITEIRSRPDGFVELGQNPLASTTVLNEFSGSTLSEILFQMKNSPEEGECERYSKIRGSFQELTSTIFDVVLQTVQSPPGTPALPGQLQQVRRGVSIITNDGPGWVSLQYTAAGIFELLAILTLLEGENGRVILLDEPALNVHPTKQVELRRILKEASSRNQIVVVTHSPILVTMEDAPNTWRFFKEDGTTHLVHLGSALEPNQSVANQMGGNLSEAEWGEMLFASGVVLVDGASDKIVMDYLDSRPRPGWTSLRGNNWVVVDSGGKKGLPAFVKLLRSLKIQYVVLADRDALMSCDTTSEVAGRKSILPSVVARLSESGIITNEDIIQFVGFAQEANQFKPDLFVEVARLARKYDIFVLPSDLEGVLGLTVGTHESKPRSALKAIEDALQQDKIPKPLSEFSDFVKQKQIPVA